MTILPLLKQIKNAEVVLPAIQRDFDWSAARIYRLLDSIGQGYPIGMILLWETYQDIQYRTFVRDFWPCQITPIQRNGTRKKLRVILDGQQRLQALYSALFGTYKGKSLYMDVLGGKGLDESSVLKHDFKFLDLAEITQWQSTRPESINNKETSGGKLKHFIKVSDLLAYTTQEKTALRKRLAVMLSLCERDQERLEINLSRFDEILTKSTSTLQASIIDEDLPSDSFLRKSEADVLEIFIRINREGIPLRRSDLTFSVLKLYWKESAVSLPEFVRQINDGNSFHLDVDFVMRCLFAVSGLGTRFDPDLLRNQSVIDRLRDNFPKCCDAIRSLVDVVMKDCWCSSSELIGGQGTLVPFAYYLFHTYNHEVPPSQMANFRKALYLFGFAKPFSRSAESRMRKFILRELRPRAERYDESFPLAASIWWVRYWESYASFDTRLLQANPALAHHLVQGRNGAKAQYWRNFEELDHIFPRSELGKRGYDESGISHFANFWILGKGKNINKSAKPPAEYFKDVDDEELKNALIDRDWLEYALYKRFLKKRSQQILEVVKSRLEFTDEDFRTSSYPFRVNRQTRLSFLSAGPTEESVAGTRDISRSAAASAPLQAINHAGEASGSKPIVNIDHSHIAGAAIEHAQQGGYALETGAITDAGGNSNDWHGHQACHYTWQRSFHPGHADDHPRLSQLLAMAHQAVNAGDAHVIKVRHRISHQLGGYQRFFRRRNVGRAG